jgi:uncharacterized protein YkwD
MRTPSFPLSLALCLVLAACGGGHEDAGDASSAASSPIPEAASAAPAEQAQATTTTTTISANCGLSNFASEALQRLNAYRASGASCGTAGYFPPATALRWNTPLIASATGHSKDMVARNYFSHTGSDGSNAGQRDTAAGYSWWGWGENIAAGQTSVASVVGAWMSSPGHCANIMNAKFRDVGLACVKGTSSNTYRTYWSMELGTPR